MGHLRELTERLKRINFSKHVILIVNNKEMEFISDNAAAKWLQNNLELDFGKSLMMIKSGFWNVDEWIDNDYKQIEINYYKFKPKSIGLLNKFINLKHLSKQTALYTREIKLNPIIYEGVCAVISTYNAYPKLFDENINNAIKLIDQLGQDKYDNIFELTDYLNSLIPNSPIEVFKANSSKIGKELESKILSVLDRNIPVVLGGLDSELNGHVATLLGYDNDNYYIYDNALDDNKESVLIDQLATNFKKKILNNKMSKNQLYRYLDKFKLTRIKYMLEHNKKDLIYHEIYNNKYLHENLRRDNRFIRINKNFLYNAYTYITIMYMNEIMYLKDYRNWIKWDLIN